MALETLDNQIDITDLSIESQTQPTEQLFDFEAALSPEVIEQIYASLVEYEKKTKSDSGELTQYANDRALLKFLVPEIYNQLDWPDLRLAIDSAIQNGPLSQRLEILRDINLLYPGELAKITRLGPNIMAETIGLLKIEPDHKPKWQDLVERAAMFRVAFPSEPLPFKLDEQTWRETTAFLKGNFLGPRGFGRYVSQLRLLFPDRLSELNYDKEDWKAMAKIQKDLKVKKSWHVYLSHLYVLKTLAAEQIRITSERGLELIMPGDLDRPKTPTFPNQRKF